MTALERLKQWKQLRRDIGWTHMSLFVPPRLRPAIKEFIRVWRFNNPDDYKIIKQIMIKKWNETHEESERINNE